MSAAALSASGAARRPKLAIGRDLAAATATLSVVAAGAAVVEAALLPGLAIGGAAILAGRLLPGGRRVAAPLRASWGSMFPKTPAPTSPGRALVPAASAPTPASPGTSPLASRFAIKRSVVKTITFRTIVTTLDFTTNYVVLGEFATAAGLSAFTLGVGPVLYLAHEAAWNYYGPAVPRPDERRGLGVAVRLPWRVVSKAEPEGAGDFVMNRALAKTITFRSFATAMDFTVNFLVVGDVATAVLLSSTGFLIGPFVYWGHETAWDRYWPAD